MGRKINKYSKILVEFLVKYALEWLDEEFEYQFINDSPKHIYQVVHIGWDKEGIFRHAIVFHFQIRHRQSLDLLQ